MTSALHALSCHLPETSKNTLLTYALICLLPSRKGSCPAHSASIHLVRKHFSLLPASLHPRVFIIPTKLWKCITSSSSHTQFFDFQHQFTVYSKYFYFLLNSFLHLLSQQNGTAVINPMCSCFIRIFLVAFLSTNYIYPPNSPVGVI